MFLCLAKGGVHCDPENDPLSAHIASLRDQKWKTMRAQLSPAFTAGKLKAMFSTLVDCGSNLQNHLQMLCDNDELLDIREITAAYSTDVKHICSTTNNHYSINTNQSFFFR